MSGLTLIQLDLKEEKLKDLLDEPAQKFLKADTILTMITRSYDLINFQIDINSGNQIAVSNAIYAIAAWMCFGTYGQSISNSLQLQDLGSYRINLEHYKEIAEQFSVLIGINLSQTTEQVVSDPIAVIDTGRSLLDEDDITSG